MILFKDQSYDLIGSVKFDRDRIEVHGPMKTTREKLEDSPTIERDAFCGTHQSEMLGPCVPLSAHDLSRALANELVTMINGNTREKK